MKSFTTKTYNIYSPKMPEGEKATLVVLADLHGNVFGEHNCLLEEEIRRNRPDAILVAGDMVMRRDGATLETAQELLLKLALEYPVFYALGNHEYKMLKSNTYCREYLAFEERLTRAGIRFLHNTREKMCLGGVNFYFYGLELPLEYYKKGAVPHLSRAKMQELTGKPRRDGINVLLAHNPRFGNTYFSWGADFTVCGHYHGGVMRFSRNAGLVSPYLSLLPSFCCGDFHKKDRHMFVSAGLGEHTFPIRINNPRELMVLRINHC